MIADVACAADADAPQLAAILSDWIDETDWMPRLHSRAEDQGFVAGLIAAHEVFVVRRDGQITGFLARDGEEIPALYVARAGRGLGLGSHLMSRAKEGRAALRLWTFQANAGARRFYSREGFVEVEWTDGSGNEAGLPDVRLEWRRG